MALRAQASAVGYAYELYSWVFPVAHISRFLTHGLHQPLTKPFAIDKDPRFYVEESFYHFASTQPDWRSFYKFVDVMPAMRAVLSSRGWTQLLQAVAMRREHSIGGMPVLERLGAYLPYMGLDVNDTTALSDMLHAHGVSILICENNTGFLTSSIARGLDICVSCTTRVLQSDNHTHVVQIKSSIHPNEIVRSNPTLRAALKPYVT